MASWQKKIKENLLARRAALEKKIAENKKFRQDSPSRMEARYDSSRAEYQYLITALERELKDVDTLLKTIGTIKNIQKIGKFLLVPPGLGGLKIDGLILVSSDSEVGKQLIKNQDKKEFQKWWKMFLKEDGKILDDLA